MNVYEEEQQEREQSTKCSSEPSEKSFPQVISELAFLNNGNMYASKYIKSGQQLSVTHFRSAGSGATGFSDYESLPVFAQNNYVWWESDIVPNHVQFVQKIRYGASSSCLVLSSMHARLPWRLAFSGCFSLLVQILSSKLHGSPQVMLLS
jgi:hypothetical protein